MGCHLLVNVLAGEAAGAFLLAEGRPDKPEAYANTCIAGLSGQFS
jgi:hypothetical protein